MVYIHMLKSCSIYKDTFSSIYRKISALAYSLDFIHTTDTLQNLKDDDSITVFNETIYNAIFLAGSLPGFMYGLTKVNKIGTPLRPIISSIGTFNNNFAKFLVRIIKPLTNNEDTTLSSVNFVNEIKHLRVDDTTAMASFDVESLFTNVPLKETIKIIFDYTSEESLSKFGLNKKQFESLVNIATKDSVFTFGNHSYTQADGVAMGSHIGPTHANAVLYHHEKIWLHNCPA
ncbi:uncharacterized protein LOC122255522 [Penaeus japonicus]|uniref:uncharacterized protein LOC122255522 n=1 Tax=Penaeus japonicus TaxID=27405 RepID=UPI001C70DF53|nr:uncharacterized protein LOC122255522 [Penaeus japonicus]